jgi:hypothetical protein
VQWLWRLQTIMRCVQLSASGHHLATYKPCLPFSPRSEQARWDMGIMDLPDDVWQKVFEFRCEDWEKAFPTKDAALGCSCVCRRWKVGRVTSQRGRVG